MQPSSPTTDPLGDAAAASGDDEVVVAPWPEPPSGILDLGRSHPIAEVVYRHRAQVGGRIRSIRVRPWGEVPTLEAVVADDTAAITVAFAGRRSLGGVQPGETITVEGMVGQRDGKLIILNPAYRLGPTT